MFIKKNDQRLTVMLVLLAALFLLNVAQSLYAQTEDLPVTQAGDIATLTELNQGYLISYRTGNAEWFAENLTDDFRETAPDGTILDKQAFLQKIASRKGGSDQSVRAGELEIRLFENLAIVHAFPIGTTSSGEVISGGRYTDVYYKIAGRWLCVTAHLGGS